jgi:predicted aspartyl protease
MPRDLVDTLGLPVLGGEEIELVGDLRTWADISLVRVPWLGEEQDAQILVSDGTDSLIGTELLRGTRLTIDYAAGIVSINKD